MCRMKSWAWRFAIFLGTPSDRVGGVNCNKQLLSTQNLANAGLLPLRQHGTGNWAVTTFGGEQASVAATVLVQRARRAPQHSS
ncbi:hypothetical protein IF1G_01352 [Cordyceps javanica]|uniref:Secreted protein n=1 Tax=Cordyceps javanica TaxID=43265 RepID=A0A545VBN4_9HYPO|nr:hypothetical protein IF1G_01352 [Cordyceps javanica]